MPGGINGHGRVPRTVSRGALIVAGNEKGRDTLKLLLEGTVFRPAALAAGSGEARRLLLSMDFDAVLISAPLPDEFGLELAAFAAEQGLGVLLAVRDTLLDEVAAQAAAEGVFTVGKPFSRSGFAQALAFLDASDQRVRRLREENDRLRAKLEEIKAVDRAKCLLMERQGLSENEAHRWIEKTAMDRRTTRRAIAQAVFQEFSEKDGGGALG